MNTPTLIFIYNADAGLWNGLVDLMHKTLSPATYTCQLCMISYNTFGMKRVWREFVQALPVATLFLHRDEFRRAYPEAALPALPCVLWQANDQSLHPFIDAQEMNALPDIAALMEQVRHRLPQILS